MTKNDFVPLAGYEEPTIEEMLNRSKTFYLESNKRRSVRSFSERSFPIEIIKNCLSAAGTAPSGANMQPWHFVVVANPSTKKKIREGAEKEEREFYSSKAPQDWLDVLAPLGTNYSKPFLEKAPYLIIIFEKKHDETSDGKKIKHYYTKESVGIATGLLINAIHNAGLVSLTHTPSPMNFLNDILNRPQNEKPFLILVVGYPEENVTIPDIRRKGLEQIATFLT